MSPTTANMLTLYHSHSALHMCVLFFAPRYPYLLQDDATFTNTLLIHGWRQRLYIKPERHTLNSDSRSSRGRGNNSEFLWQSAHILEAADFVDNDRGDEDGVRDGVW